MGLIRWDYSSHRMAQLALELEEGSASLENLCQTTQNTSNSNNHIIRWFLYKLTTHSLSVYGVPQTARTFRYFQEVLLIRQGALDMGWAGADSQPCASSDTGSGWHHHFSQTCSTGLTLTKY
jgi:hypothetical protein